MMQSVLNRFKLSALKASWLCTMGFLLTSSFMQGCSGCDDSDDIKKGSSLVAVFAGGSSRVPADGQSRAEITLYARTDGEADKSEITVTRSLGAGDLYIENAVQGATLTGVPDDSGQLSFAFVCANNTVGDVTLQADNGKATAAITIKCTPPPGSLNVVLNTSNCVSLQADALSSCLVDISATSVLGESSPAADLDVRISVAEILDPILAADAAEGAPAAGESRVLLAANAASGAAAQSSVTVTTNDEGQAQFKIISPVYGLQQKMILEAKSEGTSVRETVEISAFQNKANLVLAVTPEDVASEQEALIEVTATAPNGQPPVFGASSSKVQLRLPEGTTDRPSGEFVNDDTLGVVVDDVTGVATATLNGEGKAQIRYKAPQIAADASNYDVEITAEYDPESRDIAAVVKTKKIRVFPEGTLTLESSFNPAEIHSDRAERTTLTVGLKDGADPVSDRLIQLRIRNDSQSMIRFVSSEGIPGNPIPSDPNVVTTFTDVTWEFTGASLQIPVEARPPQQGAPFPRGIARIDVSYVDDNARTVTRTVQLNVVRDPILQSIVFRSASPEVIGVRGSSMTTSSVVTFSLFDDENQPMVNQLVTFSKNTTADPQISVIQSAISDGGGNVSTVLSSGSIAGPVSVVAQAGDLFAASAPIAIIGGLPNHLNSWVTCGTCADYAPLSDTISVTLTDRFTNPAQGGLQVQFRAEGGNITANSSTGGGNASGSYVSGGQATGGPAASMFFWSYGAYVPFLSSELPNGAPYVSCFDNRARTGCDVVSLCDDDTNALACPLPPSKRGSDSCVDDIDLDVRGLLNLTASQQRSFALDVAQNPLGANASILQRYKEQHRRCGYPLSCLIGNTDSFDGLSFVEGDECPVQPGCIDFSPLTTCPQDGLVNTIASVRGEESFVDQNGNGKFDFDDVNSNGYHDVGEEVYEQFVDLPEPFLDRNNSCSRDDFNDVSRMTTMERIASTDLYSDVSRDGQYGFNGDVTNGVWDSDTEIFFSQHLMVIAGSASARFGEACDMNQAFHTCSLDASMVVPCEESPGGGIATGCAPSNISSDKLRDNTVINFAYQWSDANDNCPSPGFASVAGVGVFGPVLMAAGETTLDKAACGFSDGTYSAEYPWCQDISPLSSPILFGRAVVKCDGATDLQEVILNLTLTGETDAVYGFTIQCPVCGDGIVEGEEQCEPSEVDPDACTTECTFPEEVPPV